MVHRSTTIWTLVVVIMTAGASADTVDDYIEKQRQRFRIPGLSVAVVKAGAVIKAKGYGLANLETNTAATPETVYQLASVTKQFTAAAVMLLVQDGRLALDDPVARYVNGAPEERKGVTVRHLLAHTSGIPDYLKGPLAGVRDDTTPGAIIQAVSALPPTFAPGQGWEYSNTNYLLLGLIVQRVAGQRFDGFLADRVFRPLGMTATRMTSADDVIPDRAALYTWNGSEWQNAAPLNPTIWDNGSGGFVSTVLDLAKWDAALASDRILGPAAKQQMWTGVSLNEGRTGDYGFGWGVLKVLGHRLLEVNGARLGAAANVARYVDDGLTVILLMNGGAEPGLISRGVARQYLPSLSPSKTGPRSVEARLLAEYAGRYEFENNFTITARPEGANLAVRFPGRPYADWLPESETTFFSEELPVRITFDRDTSGRVVGLTWQAEERTRKIPRIGPLVASLKPQPGPASAVTVDVRAVFEAMAEGGPAIEHAPRIAPGMRKSLSGNAKRATWWAQLGVKSMVFVAAEDIPGRGVERNGTAVVRVLYYRLDTARGEHHALVYLTAGALVTDVDVVTE